MTTIGPQPKYPGTYLFMVFSDSLDSTRIAPDGHTDTLSARMRPWNLIPLSEMVAFSVKVFVDLLDSLKELERIASSEGSPDEQIGDDSAKSLLSMVRPMIDPCSKAELDSGISQLARVERGLCGVILDRKYTYRQFGADLRDFRNRVNDALGTRLFTYISADRKKFFDKEPPFGQLVQDKFPEATADLVDASHCLGVGLPTAAVFHLCCAAERAIHRFARQLRIARSKIDFREWGRILGAIDNRIESMPSKRTKERLRKEQYSEAAAHLHHVKDAWRNPTMHSRRRYDWDEAEAVFRSLKDFMNYLATTILD